MTKPNRGRSLDDLDERSASDIPYEFELIMPDGKGSGVWLSVLGQQSPRVVEAVEALQDENRRQMAFAHAKAAKARPGTPDSVVVTPTSDDRDFVQRSAAVRLVGWRGPGETDGLPPEAVERFEGLSDPFSPENALKLCRRNASVVEQVINASTALEHFTKASSTT